MDWCAGFAAVPASCVYLTAYGDKRSWSKRGVVNLRTRMWHVWRHTLAISLIAAKAVRTPARQRLVSTGTTIVIVYARMLTSTWTSFVVDLFKKHIDKHGSTRCNTWSLRVHVLHL